MRLMHETGSRMTKLQKMLDACKAELEALRPDDHSEEAKRSIARLGGGYRALGLWKEALAAFDRGLRLCKEDDDLSGISGFLTWKSNVFFHSGQYGRAIELATRAVSASPTELAKAGRMSYYLALPHLLLGDLEKYVLLEEEAICMLAAAADDEQYRRLAWYRSRLARGLHLHGRSAEARELIVEQVGKLRQLNPKFGLPWAQLVRGAVEVQLGNLAEAEEALAESLSIYRMNQQEAYVVDVLTEQSRLAAARGDSQKAIRLAEEAVGEAGRGPRMSEGLADTRHLNFARAQAARAYLEVEDREQAAAAYDEALRLAAATNRGLIMRDLLRLGKFDRASPKRNDT